MKTQKEIFEALVAGKTLMNPKHYKSLELKIDENGNLNWYLGTFGNPENWEIKKVKVKKSKNIWVNIYKDGLLGTFHETEKQADAWSGADRLFCKEVIIEWEVEE